MTNRRDPATEQCFHPLAESLLERGTLSDVYRHVALLWWTSSCLRETQPLYGDYSC
jgi:hypothetical protein